MALILDFTTRPGGRNGVDIIKSRRHRDKPSLLDVSAYNATPMGMDHPKGPDGRFVDGHPSVAALGDLPDFAHRLSDADLKRAKAQNQSLASAIANEEKRRAAPAKPLKVKAPVKPIPAALADKIEAIRQRPMPGDREFLERELKGLTVAQMQSLSPELALSGSKTAKTEDLIRRLLSRLAGESITHRNHDSVLDRERNPQRATLAAEFERRKKLAVQRGDRDEYAALVAGYGIAGTGPGLPPEKSDVAPALRLSPEERLTVQDLNYVNEGDDARKRRLAREAREAAAAGEGSSKWEAHLESLAEGHKRDRELLASQLADKPAKPLKATGPRLAGQLIPAHHDIIAGMIANPISEDRDRLKGMLSAMTLPQIKQVAEKHGSGILIGANKEQKVNQLVENLIGHKLNSQAIQGGNWAGDSRMDAIAAIVANPKAGDVENLTGWLNSFKASELPAIAAKYNMNLLGRTKKEKIDNLADALVQNKLNSQAIRSGVMDPDGAASKKPTAIDKLQGKVDRLTVKLDRQERKRKSGGSRIQSAEESRTRRELNTAKRELREAKGKEVDDAFTAKMNERSAAQRAKNAPTHLETPRRTTDLGHFGRNDYHGDGQMGSVIQALKPDQARINVGGKRLDDALADVIIMGHSGEKGVSARQIQEFRIISDQVRNIDPDAADAINRAIRKINAPVSFDSFNVEGAVLPSTPAPLAQLMRDVDAAASNVFEPDAELKVFVEMARKWDIGEMSALQMITELNYFSPRRHESQEGFFEVRAAAQRAAKALEASGFKKTPRRRPSVDPAEIQSTRNALEEARHNLESQYGEDPDRWPEARQDREVEAYYDLRDKLARLEGR